VLLALAYVLLAWAVIAYERGRQKPLRFDQLSVASIFFLANVAVPAAVIHLVVDGGLLTPAAVAESPLLESAFRRLTGAEEWTVFIGSCLAFAALAVGYRLVVRRHGQEPDGVAVEAKVVRASTGATVVWVVLGLVLFVLMLRFGDSLAPGYPLRGLLLSIYYRAEDPYFDFERSTFNATAYALTHTFLLIALIGYALADEQRRRRYLLLGLTLLFVAIAVVASGARRTLLIVALIVYVYAANRRNSYRVKLLVGILVAAVPLLYFGKAFLRGIGAADGMEIDTGVPWLNQVLVAASEIGISHVESLGTVSLYDGGPRLAVDHVLSVLRFMPDGILGLHIPWPERIVRISTAYLTGDPNAQDVPPGYIGQCWIDLPAIGFMVAPLLHGMTFGLVERVFRRVDLRASPAYLMGYILFGYIVALPLNSGTLDFVFGIDIAATVFVLLVLNAMSKGGARASLRDPSIPSASDA
jgi:hypothetical protein